MLVPVRQTEHVSTAGGGGGSPRNSDADAPHPRCRLGNRGGGRRFSAAAILQSPHEGPVKEDEETEWKDSSLPASDLASKDRDRQRPFLPECWSCDLSQSGGAGGSL